MLMELLNTGLGPFKVKIWLAILAALAMVAFVIIEIADNRDKRMIETAEESGASKGLAESQGNILDQVEKANDAEKDLNRGGDADRYARCLQDATAATRGNCERFRPVSD